MAHLVFVESNLNGFDFLKEAKLMGHTVTYVFSNKNLSMSKKYSENNLLYIDKLVETENSFDPISLYNTISELHSNDKIDSIITVLDLCVISVSYVADRLGIMSTSYESVMLAKNKFECRQYLKKHGVEVGNSIEIKNKEDFDLKANDVSYPCVIKPKFGSGSYFAHVISSQDDLIDKVSFFYNEFTNQDGFEKENLVSNDLVVEDFFKGELFSVELGIHKSDVFVFTVGQRKVWGKDNVVELGTTMPPLISEKEIKEIEKYAVKIVELLNPVRGIFHVEIIYTKNGPRLIEVNPRIMGGNGPILISKNCNINIFNYLVRIYTDDDIQNKIFLNKSPITSRIFGAAIDFEVNSDFDLGFLQKYKENLVSYNIMIKPGMKLKATSSNFGYYGAFQVVASSNEESIMLADEILDEIERRSGGKLTK